MFITKPIFGDRSRRVRDRSRRMVRDRSCMVRDRSSTVRDRSRRIVRDRSCMFRDRSSTVRDRNSTFREGAGGL